MAFFESIADTRIFLRYLEIHAEISKKLTTKIQAIWQLITKLTRVYIRPVKSLYWQGLYSPSFPLLDSLHDLKYVIVPFCINSYELFTRISVEKTIIDKK